MKKGSILEKNLLGIIIFIILVLIIIFFVVTNIKKTDKSIDESKCYKEVVAHIQAVKLSNGEYAPPINCPTVFETLKEKKEKEIEFALAERMRKCWRDWQEGKKELFTGKGIFCHPCYITSFEKKDVKINDFDKFLINTRIKGQKYTYMQYLTGNTNDKNFASEKLLNNPKIKEKTNNFGTDTSKIILFYYIKDSKKIKEMMEELKSVGLGVAIGAGTGAIVFGGLGAFICSVIPGVGTIVCAVGGAKIGGIIGGTIGSFVGSAVKTRYPLWLSFILIRDYNAEELNNLGCEIAPATQKNTKE